MKEILDEKEEVKAQESMYDLTEKLSSHEYSAAVLARFKR